MLHNKILVVDDEPDLQLLVMQRFRHQIREGLFQFDFAENGLVALSKISEQPDFSLVLTDINMPEMDGLTLLEQLRKNTRDDLKAVVVSAYGDMDNIRTAMNRGAYDFITKPIDFTDLETTINKTIDEVGRIRLALEAQNMLSSLQFELETAARIQQRILKRSFPAFPDRKEFDLFASMNAARQVGGDLYDFFFIDSDRLVFLVGDVSGKGVPAAIYMAVCRTMIRAVASQVVDPGECLRKVNEMLIPESDLTTFVTVFYGVYNTKTGELRYCNGGHNLPYLRRKNGGLEMLEDTDGLLLGKIPNIDYGVKKVQLEPGDHLLVFTDGVTEAMNMSSEFYEEARLEELLKKTDAPTAESMAKTVLKDVLRFANGADPSDDITVLDLMRV